MGREPTDEEVQDIMKQLDRQWRVEKFHEGPFPVFPFDDAENLNEEFFTLTHEKKELMEKVFADFDKQGIFGDKDPFEMKEMKELEEMFKHLDLERDKDSQEYLLKLAGRVAAEILKIKDEQEKEGK